MLAGRAIAQGRPKPALGYLVGKFAQQLTIAVM
jgi:hypothetical protein